MIAVLFAAAVAILLWGLLARSLERKRVAPALVLAASGCLVAIVVRPDLADVLYSPATERAVEMILALLLFVDATEVRGGLLGRDRVAASKLVLIALPLSLILATLAGAFMLPATSFAVLLMIACAVMPTDLSPLNALFANDRVPERIRHLLNVESGYNDAVVAPLFVFALALLEGTDTEAGVWRAIFSAGLSAVVSLTVGVGVGLIVGSAANLALSRGLTSARTLGCALIMAALLTYGIAVVSDGNGFVAAFVCGIVYRLTRTKRLHGPEMELVEDVAQLCNLLVWFAFGLVLVYIFTPGMVWSTTALFIVLAATVFRFVPVWLALTRSRYTPRERTLIAAIGPRGTASVVFGLLAWTKVAGNDVDDASLILITVVGTVAVSLLMYSAAAVHLAARPKEGTPC